MKRLSVGIISYGLTVISPLLAAELTSPSTTIHMDMYLIAERIGLNLSTQRLPLFAELGYTHFTSPNTENDPTNSLYAGLGVTGPLDPYEWSSAKLSFGPMYHSKETWSDFDTTSFKSLESDTYASVNLALHIHPKVALHLRGTQTWQGLSYLQGGVSWQLQ